MMTPLLDTTQIIITPSFDASQYDQNLHSDEKLLESDASYSWGASQADIDWLKAHTSVVNLPVEIPTPFSFSAGWEYTVPEKQLINGITVYDSFYGDHRQWNPQMYHDQFVCLERVNHLNYHIIFANAFRKIGIEFVFEGKEYIYTYWYPGDGYVHEIKIGIYTNASGKILLELSSGHVQGYTELFRILAYYLQYFTPAKI